VLVLRSEELMVLQLRCNNGYETSLVRLLCQDHVLLFSDAQSSRLNALTTVRNFTQKYKTSVAKGAKCLVPAFDLVLTAGIDEKGREGCADSARLAQTRVHLSWSLDRKGRIDSPLRLPQRRIEVH
jgi:hypothetical protein